MNIAFSAAKNMSLGNGALVAVIGFIIVLAVLALLVGIFYLSGVFFQSKLFNKKKTEPAPQPTQHAETAEDDTDDTLVAVITAAVACMLEEECDGEAPEFVIKRIVRKK